MFLTSFGLKWTLPIDDDGKRHGCCGCTCVSGSLHLSAKVWQMLSFLLAVMAMPSSSMTRMSVDQLPPESEFTIL